MIQPLSLPAEDRRPDGPLSSTKNFEGVEEEKRLVAKENSGFRRGDDGNERHASNEYLSDPLCQLMVEAGIATGEKRSATILYANRMIKM